MANYAYVPLVAPLTRPEIEARAERLVQEYRPGLLSNPGPFPIAELLEFDLEKTCGVQFWVSDSLPSHVEGVTYPLGERGPAETFLSERVFDDMDRGAGRARFTGAHEVGHAVLHVRQLQQEMWHGTFGGLHRKAAVERERNPEWQANAYAAALLMPAPSVAIAYKQFGDVGRPALARTFGVSFDAMTYRLVDLRRMGKI